MEKKALIRIEHGYGDLGAAQFACFVLVLANQSSKITEIAMQPTEKPAYWVVVTRDGILTPSATEFLPKCKLADLPLVAQELRHIELIGHYQSIPCYLLNIQGCHIEVTQWQVFSLRQLLFYYAQQNWDFALLARGWQLAQFRRTHQFCGQCASPMHAVANELAMACEKCQLRCYPRISPCIIVAIRKADRILLAQGELQKARQMHSVLAGFVELGESLEQAVHREVKEEVGINIKNLRYFASQPWPFPHSLMVGYIADYASGEIQVDGQEILNADWYLLDELPTVPPNISIAGQLISQVKAEIDEGKADLTEVR